MSIVSSPFVPSEVEGREVGRQRVSTTLDTNGIRGQFPGLTPGWHYLDAAATAQKPQAVIDATVAAMGRDYATVHRGVYARSADMTLAYEAARRRIAAFIGAKEEQIAFVRGATEAINLVAYSHPKKGRVLLSTLEHHSNIVPWQLAGWQVDVWTAASTSTPPRSC